LHNNGLIVPCASNYFIWSSFMTLSHVKYMSLQRGNGDDDQFLPGRAISSKFYHKLSNLSISWDELLSYSFHFTPLLALFLSFSFVYCFISIDVLFVPCTFYFIYEVFKRALPKLRIIFMCFFFSLYLSLCTSSLPC